MPVNGRADGHAQVINKIVFRFDTDGLIRGRVGESIVGVFQSENGWIIIIFSIFANIIIIIMFLFG